jgi:hypothetical protein
MRSQQNNKTTALLVACGRARSIPTRTTLTPIKKLSRLWRNNWGGLRKIFYVSNSQLLIRKESALLIKVVRYPRGSSYMCQRTGSLVRPSLPIVVDKQHEGRAGVFVVVIVFVFVVAVNSLLAHLLAVALLVLSLWPWLRSSPICSYK